MTAVVIYAFRSPGSGAVYLGKHEPKVDPTPWPRRGHGYLPDGYMGKGVVVPRFHAKHGAAVQWRILAVVATTDWVRAERRAIRLARHLFGRLCVNVLSGGEGFTSAEARALNADPAVKVRHRAATKEALARPEVKARHSAALRVVSNRPEGKARRRATMQAVNARPDVRASAHSLERLAFLATIRDNAKTPEAIAKCKATKLRNFIRAANARNKARRAIEAQV